MKSERLFLSLIVSFVDTHVGVKFLFLLFYHFRWTPVKGYNGKSERKGGKYHK